MRLVGLLLVLLGGVVLWSEIQGQNPLTHLRQLQDLFGHQHLTGSSASHHDPFRRILDRQPPAASTSASNSTNPPPAVDPWVTPVAS